VKPIGSTAYPLPAKRPRNPVIGKDKVKRIFGVQLAHWEHQLRSCLAELGGRQ
jgi:dTDP-4-dehydrorhamnose reductase